MKFRFPERFRRTPWRLRYDRTWVVERPLISESSAMLYCVFSSARLGIGIDSASIDPFRLSPELTQEALIALAEGLAGDPVGEKHQPVQKRQGLPCGLISGLGAREVDVEDSSGADMAKAGFIFVGKNEDGEGGIGNGHQPPFDPAGSFDGSPLGEANHRVGSGWLP